MDRMDRTDRTDRTMSNKEVFLTKNADVYSLLGKKLFIDYIGVDDYSKGNPSLQYEVSGKFVYKNRDNEDFIFQTDNSIFGEIKTQHNLPITIKLLKSYKNNKKLNYKIYE